MKEKTTDHRNTKPDQSRLQDKSIKQANQTNQAADIPKGTWITVSSIQSSIIKEQTKTFNSYTANVEFPGISLPQLLKCTLNFNTPNLLKGI